MTQRTGPLADLIRGFFSGGDGPESDAWIDSETLTPREARLRRITRVFQWGAIANAALGVVFLLLVIFADVANNDLGRLLLPGAQSPADTVLLLGILGTFGNVAALLLLAVGTMAQEAWTLLLLLIALAANIAGLALWFFTPAVVALVPIVWGGALALPDLRAYHGNPVTIKELRGRMRGVRAFAIITIFLTLMSSFTVILYLLRLPEVAGQRTISPGELGRELFRGVVAVEMLLVIFIVPALTAGAVTGERERKTYDLLQTTLLSAPAFLVGKMESALGYILLLLLSAIPLQSIAFLFGGVSELEVILAFVILVATALLLGAMGLFFSARTERTLQATVRVYIAALVLILGIPAASVLVLQNAFGNAISGLAPVAGASATLETALVYLDMFAASLSPIVTAFFTQQMLVDHQALVMMDVQLASTGAAVPVLSPWLLLTGTYIAGTALLILMAVRRMRRTVVS